MRSFETAVGYWLYTLNWKGLNKISNSFQIMQLRRQIFFIKGDYALDFEVDSSCYELLGFNRIDNFKGLYLGKKIVNIIVNIES